MSEHDFKRLWTAGIGLLLMAWFILCIFIVDYYHIGKSLAIRIHLGGSIALFIIFLIGLYIRDHRREKYKDE